MPETNQPGSPRTVYCHGRILPAAEARLPIDDWGVLYGLGFFETFRTSGGQPHHWNFNHARLAQACAAAGIAMPPNFLATDETRLRETIRTLLRENKMSDAVFRYTLTAVNCTSTPNSASGDFRTPAEFLTLRPLPSAAPAEGIALRVLALPRDNGEWLPRPKSLNYANAIAGARELQRRSAVASDEGLFLTRGDRERFVVETPRQAIAWFAGGKLCYPDPALGAVASTCLHWALPLGFAAETRRATLAEFLTADAIIVLNAVRGITAVREVWDEQDRVRLRTLDSHAHPSVVKLRQAWSEALRATAANA